jgi:drug/metabolite transporter (DMT)-like permease
MLSGNLSPANALSLFAFTWLMALGQLLFKRAGLEVKGHLLADGLNVLMRSPAFYAALFLYGLSTLLWIWILSRVSLSQAYPWVAVTITIVPLLGWLVFGERMSAIYWLGIVFVIVGVMLTQYSQGR